MTPKILTHILTEHAHGKRDGQLVRFAEDVDLTVFTTLGSEALTIVRVSSAQFEDELVILDTHRKERYVVVYEDVRAIRVGSDGGRAGIVS